LVPKGSSQFIEETASQEQLEETTEKVTEVGETESEQAVESTTTSTGAENETN
jgi:hypothetical protein